MPSAAAVSSTVISSTARSMKTVRKLRKEIDLRFEQLAHLGSHGHRFRLRSVAHPGFVHRRLQRCSSRSSP
jgi:hypothetical protein